MMIWNDLEGESMDSRKDNWFNLIPIAVTYLYVAGVVALALSFFWSRESWGISLWWDIPIGIIALLLIAPAQHRLWVLLEEAALGNLFRSRWWNDFAGDWLLAFPFSTSVHHVRMQIQSHHDFLNDPEKDAQLQINTLAGFWPPKWVRFLRVSAIIRWFSLRTNFNFHPTLAPYRDPSQRPSPVALRIGTFYVLLMFAFLLTMYFQPGGRELTKSLLTYVPITMWLLMMVIFMLLPQRYYHHSTLKPIYSAKVMTLMRITYISLLNCGLGWTTFLTERSAVLNYVALWIGPMVTATMALILVRQWNQHGAGTLRNLTVRGLRKWILFPFNQDQHLTRHESPHLAWWELKSQAKS